MRLGYLVIIAIIACSQFLIAGSPGTTSGLLLIEDIGARPSGLGGAYGAGEDVNSIRYNPAGICGIKQNEFSFTHVSSYLSINYESLLLGIPFLKNKSALGLSVDLVNYGDMDKRDKFGNYTGTFGANDSVIGLSYAAKLESGFMIGGTVKYFSSKIEDENAKTVAFDIGGLYNLNESLKFGASVQNIGGKMKYITDEDDLPLNIKFSGAYEPFLMTNPPTFYFDLNIPKGQQVHFNVGCEFWFNEAIAVRGGFRDKVEEGKTLLGFGARGKFFQLDYAYMFTNKLNSTHRVSATFRFGGNKKENVYEKERLRLKELFTPKNENIDNKQNKYRYFDLDENKMKEKILLFPPPTTIK